MRDLHPRPRHWLCAALCATALSIAAQDNPPLKPARTLSPVAGSGTSAAPAAARNPAPQAGPGRKLEVRVVEDDGARVEEVRSGGRLQSVTVQPKRGGDLPPYELLPDNPIRGSGFGQNEAEGGRRVWKFLDF